MWAVKVLLCLTVAVFCVQNTQAWWITRTWPPWINRRIWTTWTTWSRWPVYSRRSRVNCEGIQQVMVTRDQWNAMKPRHVEWFDNIPNKVIVHHTGPDTCSVIGLSGSNCKQCLQDGKCLKELILALQDRDFSNGLDDIKYNFLIGQDGVVYEGRGWDVVGQHTDGQNKVSIGVALIGDFSNSEPNEASESALKDLKVCGEETGKLAPNSEVITMI